MSNENPNNQVVIFNQENITTIMQSANSYSDNELSCQSCLNYGSKIIEEIERSGMNDDTDRLIASYIEKSRRTLKVMNERRSPVTKLFDMMRGEFTKLENAIDPTKADTIPYKLQQYRNQYAAKKHAEAEKRRQEAEAKARLEQARITYRTSCETDYRESFNKLVTSEINKLQQLNATLTLENYQAVFDTLKGYSTSLPADWCPPSCIHLPAGLSYEEGMKIRQALFSNLMLQFEEQYTFEVGDLVQDLIDKLPSKRAELERAASASAEEAERIKNELAQREAAEAAQKEQERLEKERKEQEAARIKQANAEMGGLFDGVASAAPAATKVKVTKKICIQQPDGILQVISMWWQQEGCTLSVEELSKMFKKQITFCENLANKKEIFINHPHVGYTDEVKAK